MPAPSAPIRLRFSIELNYQVDGPGTDFIFNIHAAHTPAQRILEENLEVSQPVELTTYTDAATHTGFLRLQAYPGPLQVRYGAVLDITHVHGDHCYGLPGLLASAGMSGRKRPLTLIAPQPVRDWLAATASLTDLHLPFEVDHLDVASAV